MSTRQHYYLAIDDFAAARGDDPALAFEGRSPEALATAVQEALRTTALFERWRGTQDKSDEVDASLAPVDPQASAHAAQSDLHVDLEIDTDLPMQVLRHRLNLLIGSHWKLRDIR